MKVPKTYSHDVKKFVNVCKNRMGKDLKSIIIFGGIAKGKFTKKSDYDFLVVVDKYNDKKCMDAWLDIKEKVSKMIGRRVDVVMMEKKALDDITSPFALEVQAHGKVVYGDKCLDKSIFKRYGIKPIKFRGKQIGWDIPA